MGSRDPDHRRETSDGGGPQLAHGGDGTGPTPGMSQVSSPRAQPRRRAAWSTRTRILARGVIRPPQRHLTPRCLRRWALEKSRCRSPGPLLVRGGREFWAVARPGLHVQQRLEVLGRGLVGSSQKRNCLAVALPVVVSPQLDAADDVGSSDAGMDTKGHIGVSDLLIVDRGGDGISGKEEPTRLGQPAGTGSRRTTSRVSHGGAKPSGHPMRSGS